MAPGNPTTGEQLQFDFNPPPDEIPQLWTADDIWRVCDEDTIRRFSEDNRVERKAWGITQRNDLPPEKWTGLSRSALGLGRADVAQS